MNWAQAQPVGLHVSHLQVLNKECEARYKLIMWGYASHTYEFLVKNAELGTGSACGVTHPTPAVPFLLREKELKAYLRGFPLDIPWGLCPRSNRKRSRSPLSITKVRCIAGGIEGGAPPSAGNPKTRRFLVYLCLLSLHKKVGAVWSA